MRNRKGFTLAEILVTLGIIGVIASMTIPNLVQDIQDAQLKTAWKKAFADFNQATVRLLQENAGSIKGLYANRDNVRNAYMPYLNYVKTCNVGVIDCWHKANQWYYMDRTPLTFNESSILVLNSGMLVMFGIANINCSDTASGISQCNPVTIDVNGFKAPNTFGKDIFRMHLQENAVVPYGAKNDLYVGDCNTNGKGLSCAANYLYQ